MNYFTLTVAILFAAEAAYATKKRSSGYSAVNWTIDVKDESELRDYSFRPGPERFQLPQSILDPFNVACVLSAQKNDGTRNLECAGKNSKFLADSLQETFAVSCSGSNKQVSLAMKTSSKKGRYRRDRLVKIDVACSPALLSGN